MYLYFFFLSRMKIVKEHNEMAEGLEERKKSLQDQLEMVWILKLCNYSKETKMISTLVYIDDISVNNVNVQDSEGCDIRLLTTR